MSVNASCKSVKVQCIIDSEIFSVTSLVHEQSETRVGLGRDMVRHDRLHYLENERPADIITGTCIVIF